MTDAKTATETLALLDDPIKRLEHRIAVCAENGDQRGADLYRQILSLTLDRDRWRDLCKAYEKTLEEFSLQAAQDAMARPPVVTSIPNTSTNTP